MPTIVATSALSNYGAAALLALALRKRGVIYYLGLHTSDPDGPVPHELAGGGYLRDNIAFSSPSGRAVASTNPQAFQGVPTDVVRYLGVWDSISAGNLWLKLYLGASPLSVPDNGKVLLSAGDIAFKF